MQRRFELSWSPQLPAVLSSSSFDRKVQVYSMVAAKTEGSKPRAPKWSAPPSLMVGCGPGAR